MLMGEITITLTKNIKISCAIQLLKHRMLLPHQRVSDIQYKCLVCDDGSIPAVRSSSLTIHRYLCSCVTVRVQGLYHYFCFKQ
jgi:hypothetical protein